MAIDEKVQEGLAIGNSDVIKQSSVDIREHP